MNTLKKLAVATIALLMVATTSVTAQAYPVGVDMALQLSKIENINKQESLSVSASGVHPGCTVTFKLSSNEDGSSSLTLGTSSANIAFSTGTVDFTAPKNTGVYYVFGNTSSCPNQGSSTSASQSILVGRILSVATTASYARKQISTTATCTYNSKPVSNISVVIKVYKPDTSLKAESAVVKTDRLGKAVYGFNTRSWASGTYTVKWFVLASTTYAPLTFTKTVTIP